MAGVLAWLTLALVAPTLLVLPGYLVLRAFPSARFASREAAESVYEAVGLSVAISLALLVLVGFALSQTVGLSRPSLLVAHLLLIAGLILAAAARGSEDEPARMVQAAGGPVMPRRLSIALVALTLLFVAVGVGLFDGSEPYSEVYYADASNTSIGQAAAGTAVNWTIVVENHEERDAVYDVQTRLIPEGTSNATPTSGTPLDRAELELAPGERARHEVRFTAPDCCVWKVQTFVDVDGRPETLTVHRWLHVGTR